MKFLKKKINQKGNWIFKKLKHAKVKSLFTNNCLVYMKIKMLYGACDVH